MARRIDDDLARLAKLGQTPRLIEVGEDLYEELYEEQNPPVMAALVGPADRAPVHIDREVKEYKGIRVYLMSDVPKDYLSILV